MIVLGQTVRKHLKFHRWGGCGGTCTLFDVLPVLSELDFKLFQLVVVQILLNQVTLALYTSFHIRRHVRDQPGHKELHHKHHMLQENDIIYNHF